MKTNDAIRLAGSVKQLAELLKVSVQAVYLWVKAGELPELRVYRLRELRPEWFDRPAQAAPQQRHAQEVGAAPSQEAA